MLSRINKNRILITLSLLALIAINITGCGSNDPGLKFPNSQEKIEKLYNLGDSLYVSGNNEYYIEETNEKFINGLYESDEYFFTEHGIETFTVKSKSGKTIGSYKGVKVDKEIDEIVDINTYYNQYTGRIYAVDNDVDRIKLISSSHSSSQFAIMIPDSRMKPLEIIFDGISIVNKGIIPIITNYSDECIIANVQGNVLLDGGKPDKFPTGAGNKEIEDILKTSDEIFKSFIEIQTNFDKYCEFVSDSFETAKNLIESIYKYTNSVIAEGDLHSIMMKLSNDLLDLAKGATDFVYGLLTGDSGADGIDANPTITSLGDIYFKGDGYISVIGSQGQDGQNGGSGALFGGKGGDGGDSACAIVNNYIYISSSIDFDFKKGNQSHGGKDGDIIVGSHDNIGSGRYGKVPATDYVAGLVYIN